MFAVQVAPVHRRRAGRLERGTCSIGGRVPLAVGESIARTRLILLLIVAWLWPALALAAIPFQLPPGEDVGDWEGPLALGGMAPGVADQAPAVLLRASPDRWVLEVRRSRDQRVEIQVDPARSEAAREDLVWLALSLLQGSASPSQPDAAPIPPRVAVSSADPPDHREGAHIPPQGIVPTRAPASPAPSHDEPVADAPSAPTLQLGASAQEEPPATEQVTEQPGADEAVAAAEAPTTSTEVAPAPPAGPVAEDEPVPALPAKPLRPWIRLQAGSTFQLEQAPAPSGAIELGLLLAHGLRLGPSVDLHLPTRITTLGADRRLARLDLLLGAWWAPFHGISPQVGLLCGPSIRRWSQEGALVGTTRAWLAALDLGLRLPVGSGLHLEPRARLGLDLERTTLRVDGAPVGTLRRPTLEGGLALSWSAQRRVR